MLNHLCVRTWQYYNIPWEIFHSFPFVHLTSHRLKVEDQLISDLITLDIWVLICVSLLGWCLERFSSAKSIHRHLED